ncbi:hypothetical protein [Methylobacterium indicum]|uniref:N-acetyltransferase domain-containing protein n=1 Tax=Methylobacterium indicum TaxID=1775910 RepID=A0ABR5HGH1_9HYPH|nr:hypothetical protein [Methylobacterium indicum]KMO22985.1 hypothetical protein QR78_05630 [Methylobacterium indicum]KMO25675.1 hypothetical protein QR79_06455 [Methylobacterium indicum]
MSEPTLREILEPQAATAHEVVAARIASNPDDGSYSGALRFTLGDPFPRVAEWIRQGTGQWLGPQATWVRFYRLDREAGMLVVLHTPTQAGEVELTVVSDPGMVSRSILRAVSRWAFGDVCATRLVVHIPSGTAWLADYARRAGFSHEGMARDYFASGADASVWAMTRQSCRWLPRPLLAITTEDPSPPSSNARH